MRHRYRVDRALYPAACSAHRRSCCHRRPRIRETTLRRHYICVAGVIPSSARHSLGGRLAHRLSSIQRRTPSSHGRLSGWPIYSRMRIRTSLRVISVVRDKISSPSGNTSKTRRTEICAVTSINFFYARLPCSPTTSSPYPAIHRSLFFRTYILLRLRFFFALYFSSNWRADVWYAHSMCLYHYSSNKDTNYRIVEYQQ